MERRKQSRKHISVDLDVHSSLGDCVGLVRDLSVRSMFLEVTGGNSPAMDDRIKLKFNIWTGRYMFSRQASGRVVRVTDEGVAVLFTERDLVTRSVIEEVMYYVDMADHCVHAA